MVTLTVGVISGLLLEDVEVNLMTGDIPGEAICKLTTNITFRLILWWRYRGDSHN